MYRVISIVLLIILFSTQARSQELNVGFANYLTFAKSNDLGLDISYTKNLKKHAVVLGAEIRSIDWGNHLGLVLAFKADYFEKRSITIGGLTSLHPGLALFQQRSLGSFGVSYAPYIKWQSKKRSFLQVDLGFRYNISPGYEQYGTHQQIEFPLGLKWGILLGERKMETIE